MRSLSKFGWCSIVLGFAIAAIGLPTKAASQDQDQDDPPGRVARLGYLQGSISLQPAGENDWVGAVPNRPMTTGDKLWADQDSRAEVQLGSAVIRLAPNTGFSFLNLDDNTVQIQLTSGAISVTVRQLNDGDDFEVDTPNLAFTVSRPGHYRVEASEDGSHTSVSIREGDGEATGNGQTYTLHRGQRGTFSGTDSLNADVEQIGGLDDFDTWAEGRDHRYDSSRSAHYLSPDVVGYEDLDDYGDWRDDSNYGHVWFPNQVAVGWAPYHEGHWDWISPWGWTWVDDSPWGYAPFHYGRWVSVGGRWGWVAGPAAVRPVYAPALVVFIGGGPGGFGGNVGWFPLGPREVYVPSYRVSRGLREPRQRQQYQRKCRSGHQRLQHHHRAQHGEHHECDVREPERARRGDGGSAAHVRQRATRGEGCGCHELTRYCGCFRECARCRGPNARECSRGKSVERQSGSGSSRCRGEPTSGGQTDTTASSRAFHEAAAGTGRASWTTIGEKRSAEPASGEPRGGSADGEASASGKSGNADHRPSG